MNIFDELLNVGKNIGVFGDPDFGKDIFEAMGKFKKQETDEDETEASDESQEEHTYYQPKENEQDTLYGSCILEIQIKNHGEYLRWIKYNPGRKWEFMVGYPAIMRAEYDFHTAMEVELMAKKIVQLMQMGFDVYSARWRLKKYESQLKQGL